MRCSCKNPSYVLVFFLMNCYLIVRSWWASGEWKRLGYIFLIYSTATDSDFGKRSFAIKFVAQHKHYNGIHDYKTAKTERQWQILSERFDSG